MHHAGRRPVLVSVERRLDDEDGNQDDTQSEVGNGRVRVSEGSLRDEDEDASDEKNGSKALEEVSHNLPEPRVRQRRDLVHAMLLEAFLGIPPRQALSRVNVEPPLNMGFGRGFMPVNYLEL